jgi:hypothetical protein
MYNMSISLFGFKMNVMTLLFVAILVILVSHTYCGCKNNPYALIEGLETSTTPSTTPSTPSEKKPSDASLPTQVSPPGNGPATPAAAPEKVVTGEKKKEGFTGANINYGQSSPYDLASNTPVNTSSWSAPNMVVMPGQPLSPAVRQFLDRPQQPIPLPEGQMNLFFNTPFKPECCPNTFSTSTGCACMTGKQYNYLVMRGGNNVPYSEY